jgi:methyl-accepting chemotaxis protein
VIIIFVSLVAIITGSLVNSVAEYRRLKERLENQALMNARLVGEYCLSPLDFGFKDEAEANLSKLETVPIVENGCVFDGEGNVFAQYNRSPLTAIPKIPDEVISTYFETQWLHVFHKIEFQDEIKGTIYLRVSTRVLANSFKESLFSIFIIALGMIGISYLLAIALQRFISLPILKLANLTLEISKKGDYSMRIQSKNKDEIGELYKNFNTMLEQIEQRLLFYVLLR